jgi:hypothetical protein
MDIKQIIREEIDSEWGFVDDVEDELTVETLRNLLEDNEIVISALKQTEYNIINSSDYRGYAEVTIYYGDKYYGGYYYSQILDYIKDGSWEIIDIVPKKNHKNKLKRYKNIKDF